jgi:glycosyltransferase involved in cell wall biosynthesis
VEAYSGRAFLWAEIVCRLLGFLKKPYVVALHGGNLPAFAGRSPGRVKRLLQRAGAVTAPSQYLLSRMYPYRADICLIPNPIELGHYPYRVRTKALPHLVWLRAFHGIYNPGLAPLVVRELCSSFPDITLTMVGPDKGDGALQATRDLIGRLGLHAKIEIIPGIPKSQVARTLAQHDIFINTTNVDNTPVSVMEAMASGLCIVSTNVGGLPFLLEHEKNALLVRPRDPQEMAAAVRRILAEPGLAEMLSRNARSKAEEFDWPVVLPRWESLFQKIISA